MFCDQCGGAVANLHRSCWACEVDLCVECCSDLRCGGGVGSPGWKNAGGAPAATPASALVGAGKGARESRGVTQQEDPRPNRASERRTIPSRLASARARRRSRRCR